MLGYTLAALVLASWIGNALYISRVVKRAWRIPAAEEETLVARYGGRFGRGGRNLTFEKLKEQIPPLETTAPGLKYTALVPLSISATFAINALVRLVWIKDGTAGVWGSVALVFLPLALTVYLLAWEQTLLLARLKEVAYGPSGRRVKDFREKLQGEKSGPDESEPRDEAGGS